VTARRAVTVLLLGLAFCAAAVAGQPVRAQTRAPGVEFVAALQDAYDALPAGNAVPRDDPRLQRVRTPLQRARDLAPASVALAPVAADLDRNPADLQDARVRLRALIDALALPPNSVAEDPHASQAALRDVYSQDTFANVGRTSSDGGFFSRVGRGILDALRWIADHTVGALGLIPTLLIAGLIIALIVGLLVLRLHGAGIRQRGAVRSSDDAPARSVDADEEWRLAEAAAVRGEHRDAVRHAFRSALLSVAQRGRLQADAAWTTSELLARARGDADLLAALAPAAASFDRAWYSGRAVTAPDWEVARERCDAVRHLAARRRVPA
jgi:hypothetical protein